MTCVIPEGHHGTVCEPCLPLLSCLHVRVHVQEQVKRAERQILSLPQRHQDLLPDVLSNLDRISQCADHNQEILQAVVHNSLHMFENIEYGDRVRLGLQQVVYCT